jgi:hypothetical protein
MGDIRSMDGNGISSIIACVTTKVWLRNLLRFVGIRSALGYFALNMIGGLRHTVFFTGGKVVP